MFTCFTYFQISTKFKTLNKVKVTREFRFNSLNDIPAVVKELKVSIKMCNMLSSVKMILSVEQTTF